VTMPRISPPTITASAIWAYGTRTLTGLTGTPRIDLTGADEALTPSRIWAAPTRELTQAQFPFWSALLTQSTWDINVAAGSSADVQIRPPAGETWFLFIEAGWDAMADTATGYLDYDGVTMRWHSRYAESTGTTLTTSRALQHGKVLTNSLWGRVRLANRTGSVQRAFGGYSGFKLSKPIKQLQPAEPDPPKPWMRKPSRLPIPAELEGLSRYIVDLLNLTTNEYEQALLLEEDTPMLKDEKGNVVTSKTVYVLTDWFVANLAAIKADPVKTGYKPYLDKWAEEGITL